MIRLNDHNRIVLEEIKKNINNFEKKHIELGTLISNVEGWYRQRSSWSLEWDALFFERWIDLESVYARILQEDRHVLDDTEILIVNNATKAMKTLVNHLLDSYTKIPDPTVVKTAQILDENWLLCPDCLDAWESSSKDAMVICPKCNKAFHNPRYTKNKKGSR